MGAILSDLLMDGFEFRIGLMSGLCGDGDGKGKGEREGWYIKQGAMVLMILLMIYVDFRCIALYCLQISTLAS